MLNEEVLSALCFSIAAVTILICLRLIFHWKRRRIPDGENMLPEVDNDIDLSRTLPVVPTVRVGMTTGLCGGSPTRMVNIKSGGKWVPSTDDTTLHGNVEPVVESEN